MREKWRARDLMGYATHWQIKNHLTSDTWLSDSSPQILSLSHLSTFSHTRTHTARGRQLRAIKWTKKNSMWCDTQLAYCPTFHSMRASSMCTVWVRVCVCPDLVHYIEQSEEPETHTKKNSSCEFHVLALSLCARSIAVDYVVYFIQLDRFLFISKPQQTHSTTFIPA